MMMSNDFEEAFGRYLETREYDEAANVLFEATRKAFLAGWKAAGGEPPTPCRLFELVECSPSIPKDTP